MEKKTRNRSRKMRGLPVIGELVIVVNGCVKAYEVTGEGCVITRNDTTEATKAAS